MTLDQTGTAGNGRGSAVAALATLAPLAEASVSGVMLIAGKKDEEPEVSQLVPTERALPVLNALVQRPSSIAR
jgi:hypothetical protein